jgi:holo-ACP synthase CitX
VTDSGLQAILDGREARWLRRRELCGQGALLTLVMNVPGPEKNLPLWNEAHHRVTNFLKTDLGDRTRFFERRESPAGAESHFVTEMSASELKRYAVLLEESHPIGRLLDLDVMDAQGNVMDRNALDLPPRRCFCCGKAARICSRAGTHSLEELLCRAEALLKAWQNEI